MLTSHLKKLESKVKHNKIANEQLRINLQSQMDQLNINLQNTIKIIEKTRENIRKTIMEEITNVLCEILRENKLIADEVKIRQKQKNSMATELKTRTLSIGEKTI